MGSEITDDTVEPLAYAVCNTDGVEGLSWAEVEQCEVSKNKYIELRYLALVKIKLKYLDERCFLFCLFKFFNYKIITLFWQKKKMWVLQIICIFVPKVGFDAV